MFCNIYSHLIVHPQLIQKQAPATTDFKTQVPVLTLYRPRVCLLACSNREVYAFCCQPNIVSTFFSDTTYLYEHIDQEAYQRNIKQVNYKKQHDLVRILCCQTIKGYYGNLSRLLFMDKLVTTPRSKLGL